MQKFTQTAFVGIFLFSVFCFSTTAQTNVSGGIYANATWTKANNPYIVTDTVVVFPGVTLTIEPGVTVKFKKNKLLEIRGYLIASGTAVDSITFTSDSLVPYPGVWKGINFSSSNSNNRTIDYCIFKYADGCMFGSGAFSLDVAHSSFYFNNGCIIAAKTIKHCFFSDNLGWCAGNCSNVDSCTFTNNKMAAGNVSVTNSTFIGDSLAIFNGGGNIINCRFLNNQCALCTDDYIYSFNLLQNSIFCNNGCAACIGVNDIINCNFSQNHIAAGGARNISGNIFTDNDTAISGGFDTLSNNYIYHNHRAIAYATSSGDLIFNNYIFYNQVGILYGGGVSSTKFFNNYICKNTLYNIIYYSTSNGFIPPTCFCDTDSATIRSKIYDGYVNITWGLLNFTPYIHCDSSALLILPPPINCQTLVLTNVEENANHVIEEIFEIYPNPATDHLILNLSKTNSSARFKIYNMLGDMKYSSLISSKEITVDISGMANGVYLIEVTTENNIARQKFVKQQSNR